MSQKITFITLFLTCAVYSMEPVQKEKCPICLIDKPVAEFIHPTCCNSKQVLCIACYQEILKKSDLCPFCRSDNFSLEKKNYFSLKEPIQRPPSPSRSETLFYACILQ